MINRERLSLFSILIIGFTILLTSKMFGKELSKNVPTALTRFNTESNRIPWDRARGYLDQGKLQSAIANYGNFIDWDHSPAGLWGDYMYIPNLSFIFGVPGERYISSREWIQAGENLYLTMGIGDINYLFLDDVDPSDPGNSFPRFDSFSELSVDGDWTYNPDLNHLYLFSETPISERKVLVRFEWAYRPEHDNPGDTVYWGGTTQESWFDRSPDLSRVNWEAARGSLGKFHSGEVTSGDIYGGIYTREDDTYSLMATSTIPETWPITGVDDETGEDIREWPGWWAVETNPESPNYLKEVPNRFVSDTDVYFVFDDRWGFMDVDPRQGYPLGIRVYATAHSYGAAYAEDIIFVTMKVVNESHKLDFPAIDGVRDAIDNGLNGSKGFDYSGCYGGFYFDVDSYSQTADGSFSGRTNSDDMMGYIQEYDIGYIYDLDDNSSGATGLAYSGLKFLDSPLSSEYLDLNNDGDNNDDIDVIPGEQLGMTDWHWFDWYTRPGVASKEGDTGPYAGDGQTPVAGSSENNPEIRAKFGKEAVQFKVMSGNTTVNPLQQDWYFHPDPNGITNPHFDSIEGLINQYPDGLDCVFIMSSGPFDFAAGDTLYFSFCYLMGQDIDDLEKNAEMAQIMYDLRYQGFSSPSAPTVTAVPSDKKVTLYWDDKAETSTDIVTGYADFQGYKIYKSTDGGRHWGDPIYDTDGVLVGYKPIAQFDLTEEEDKNRYNGIEFSGSDPLAPWFSLGDNTGLQHTYIDTDVRNGVEYTYAVTAYDIGIVDCELDSDNNPDCWDPLPSLENSKGNNETFVNFVKVIPHPLPIDIPGIDSLVVVAGEENLGNGDFTFEVVDLESITGDEYSITIHAEHTDPEDTNSPEIDNPYFSVINLSQGETIIDSSVNINFLGEAKDIWSPFFDGVRIQLNNYPIINANYVKDVEWNEPITFSTRFGLDTLDIVFGTSQSPGAVNLFGEYRIVFGEMGKDSSDFIPSPFPTYGKVALPFSIYNDRTGEKVKIGVNDLGIDGLPFSGDTGDNDGLWTRGEALQLMETGVDFTDPSLEKNTFTNVQLDWSGKPDELPWSNEYTAVISIKTPYFDGDTWTFSTEDLKRSVKITKRDLKNSVRVVPNPYIVTAEWEKLVYSKKIEFRGLPSKCSITIFTLAGDRVQILEHDNPYDDSESWDLTTYNRQLVGPGLYLYVVEAEDLKHIGKFAIIR